jgi:hypothetical protein
MITFESVLLEPSKPWKTRILDEDFQIAAFADGRNLPTNVMLRAFGEDHRYNGFAGCVTGQRLGVFVGNVSVALQSDGIAFLAVIGLYKLLFIRNERERSWSSWTCSVNLTTIVGFIECSFTQLSDGFLINYESGIARVRDIGEVLWHRKMVWNDVFVRKADSALLFKYEINPKGFYISISDGEKSPA